jgi:hypothetical protein
MERIANVLLKVVAPDDWLDLLPENADGTPTPGRPRWDPLGEPPHPSSPLPASPLPYVRAACAAQPGE